MQLCLVRRGVAAVGVHITETLATPEFWPPDPTSPPPMAPNQNVPDLHSVQYFWAWYVSASGASTLGGTWARELTTRSSRSWTSASTTPQCSGVNCWAKSTGRLGWNVVVSATRRSGACSGRHRRSGADDRSPPATTVSRGSTGGRRVRRARDRWPAPTHRCQPCAGPRREHERVCGQAPRPCGRRPRRSPRPRARTRPGLPG